MLISVLMPLIDFRISAMHPFPAKILIDWFLTHKRDLPWRMNRTFYRVWISEVMLQQTQVNSVIPYYKRFLHRFPTLNALANAPLDDVLHAWQGLGYYSRARNLHRASIELNQRSELPETYDELIQVIGFGPYITAAVLSLWKDQPWPVIDGNVKRVMSRYLMLNVPVNSPVFKTMIEPVLSNAIKQVSPRDFNEGMMELGALICKPLNPVCDQCPLSQTCRAFAENRVDAYPIRAKRKSVPTRKMWAAVYQLDGSVWVTQRPPDGLLGGLWMFPQSPWASDVEHRAAIRSLAQSVTRKALIRHSYSHFKLELTPYHIRLESRPNTLTNGIWKPISELSTLAFDKATLKIIERL